MPANRYIHYVSVLEPDLQEQYAPQLKDEAESLLRVRLRDEIKDIGQAYDKTKQELKDVDESLAEIRNKLDRKGDNLAEAKTARDKKRAKDEIHRLRLIAEKGVKEQ